MIIKKYFEITAKSNKNTVTVYFALDYTGETWYVVDGGTIVNCTNEELVNGIDIEQVSDVDCFTFGSPIESLEDFEIVMTEEV